jgi:transposase-like protein
MGLAIPLTAEQRKAIETRFLAGESVTQIARDLGVSTAIIYVEAERRGLKRVKPKSRSPWFKSRL